MAEDSSHIGHAASSDAALFDQMGRLPRWFSAAALQPIRDINRRMLGLMAARPPGLPVANEIAEALRLLPASALERIAQCPCLLVSAGFEDDERWRGAKALAETLRSVDVAHTPAERSVTALARGTLFVAWHYARTYPEAAGLVTGTRTASREALCDLTLDDLEQLAAARSEWIQPRWANRPSTWQRLLEASDTSTRPCTAELRGLQLVLGERMTA